MTNRPQETKLGTFCGIGVGPGDPELLTLKAIRVLSSSDCIYVPTSHLSTQDYVSEVVHDYAGSECEIKEVTFSLASDSSSRCQHWQQTAVEIATKLQAGQDVAFVTLGDALLYSTYIYLVRALRQEFDAAIIETVPGVSAFSLVAALTNTPLGEGQQSLHVIPVSNDLVRIESAITSGAGVVLMKIGSRLREIVDLLEQLNVLDRSVFVSRAGLPDQRVELDLNHLRDADETTGNLAVIIVQAAGE